tara:strand:- start:1569 stop:1766 length:198 start_codon:yes stop_codon:yes gene_type:complete
MKKKSEKISLEKIKSEIDSLRVSLLNLRFQKSNGQLEKTAKIKKTKKDIARLMTSLNEKKESQNA